MAVTIKDVAARCGLSISTVSKAFNHYSDISAQTRELVRRTAREIGYYPNAIARTLKTNRSYNLGVLFQDDRESGLTHSFFASLLDAFKAESERHGFDVTFINHHIGWAGMTYLEHCRYRNVDGVCVACADFEAPEVRALVESDLPVVTIDHTFPAVPCVLSENAEGMRLLVRHAAALGHRRIAYVHGQPSAVTESRVAGFQEAMAALNIPLRPEYLVEGVYDDPGAGCKAVLNLMALPERPTCILLPDDHTVLGALEAAAQLGLRVPEELSLGGFDGIRLTQLIHPQVTTIEQDAKRMGEQAAAYLIARIEEPRQPIPTCTVPVRLLPGESMGPAPQDEE